MSSHDQVAATLGSEILRGVYPPGANLPAEPELIRRFQVSRTVIREAMKTLAAKGLVIAKTRVGTRVLDPVNWNYFDADVLAWRVRNGLDDELREHLVEVRRAIEPAAAALAARRRTARDVARLRQLVAAMGRPDHTRESFAQADLEFHVAIGAVSGNPLMRSFASVVAAALVASFSQSSPLEDERDHANTVREHASIVDAIEAQDERAAAAAMLKVIEIGVQRVAGSRSARKRK